MKIVGNQELRCHWTGEWVQLLPTTPPSTALSTSPAMKAHPIQNKESDVVNHLCEKYVQRALVIGLLSGCSLDVQAACNDPKDWFDAPGPEIKAYIGYKQEQRPGFGSFGVGQSPVDYPYPEPLPKEMLGREGTGSLSKEETSDVSYYEPDGKGNWRVCRTERWWSAPTGDQEMRKMLQPITKRYAANNPVLRKIAGNNVVMFATMYFYDKKGRITRLEQGDFRKPEQKPSIMICREYDEDDHLTLLLDPKTTQSCHANPPDVRDEWRLAIRVFCCIKDLPRRTDESLAAELIIGD
jgi:hypothetical protein